ncbi:putative aminoacrylate hydrolase RutD [Camellia lanceoleosa]|uniref:Aminoacrylate hydrolase RutD n=1 Tax=Camellia lanceoleosa TaxID=1840588 RepID=A0ACC0H728_9ERIC|nr:putative aminoacrylate hydrolase RutD [Camellia lanceoleosa]
MPFCYVASYQSGEEGVVDDGVVDNGIKIFYRTYGHGPIKVLMIIGLAGTHDSWLPQIEGLTGTVIPNDDQLMAAADHRNAAAELGGDGDDESGGVEVCAFDNRGMGRSSVPTKKSDYGTTIMANDAVALMDHLGWRKAHVFGHSMGAMISCKLAAMVPDRVLSLALLNVTGGGYQCLPKLDRKTLSIAIRFLRAKTPEQRAAVDLDTHYSKEYLEEYVGPNTRRAILYQEYVRGISASGMQSNCGFDGQINACWMHKMSRKELELICSAGFLISVIHGRHDIIAQLYYARKLAEKLNPFARMVELHGGHLVSHERTDEVNQALVELIQASEKKMNPYDWTNIHKKNSGSAVISFKPNFEGGSKLSFMIYILEKLHVFVLYFFSLFVLAFEYLRRGLKSLKPVKVGPALTCSI